MPLDRLTRDVVRWQAGDKAAGEAIVRNLAAFVRASCCRRLIVNVPGSVSRTDAREVESYVWEAVFRMAAVYDPVRGCKFITPATHAIRHAITEYYRVDGGKMIRSGRYAKVDTCPPVVAAETLSEDWEQFMGVASETPENSVTRIAVRQMLSRLRKRERAALLLRLDGLTLAEIGARIGCSECRTFQIIRGAQAKMRDAAGLAEGETL